MRKGRYLLDLQLPKPRGTALWSQDCSSQDTECRSSRSDRLLVPKSRGSTRDSSYHPVQRHPIPWKRISSTNTHGSRLRKKFSRPSFTNYPKNTHDIHLSIEVRKICLPPEWILSFTSLNNWLLPNFLNCLCVMKIVCLPAWAHMNN